MSCKYCDKGDSSVVWDKRMLDILRKNDDYIYIAQEYRKNEARIIVECATKDKISRTKADINYCCMCGRKLRGDVE
jgi:hypothetical protein